MRKFALPTTVCALFVAVIALAPIAIAAPGELSGDEQVATHHGSEEQEFHRNHFGAFLGASTHLDTDETAITLGLEYARVVSRRWAFAAYMEMAGSDIERDVILAAGVIYYPIKRLGLLVAPGVESVSKDVEHGGEVTEESETELLVRFGAAYGFSLAPTVAIGPAVFADHAGDRWTIIYGLSWVAGF